MAYNHSTQLENLDSAKYELIDLSQDIESTLEMIGFPEDDREDITGIIVILEDGDYSAVWLTESSRPYDLYSTYHALPYYKPEEWNNNKNLPYYWSEENPEYTV